MAELFIQLTIIIGIATLAALSVRLLRQPFIIAYLATGIVAGPALFNLLSAHQEIYDIFAHLGVILLLFVVGLSLNLNHIKQIGKVAVVVGIIQCIITSGLGFFLLYALRLPFMTAIFIAIAATFSSTIIITKLLGDKRDTDAVYGRYTIGLMVVQDVIAILILLFLTTSHLQSAPFIIFFIFFLKAIVLVALLFIVAKYLLPYILDRIAGSGELLLLFTVSWCFVVAPGIY
ncbi:MAG: cation:proton antiporter, partial [Patescibacteria group bacterium]